MARKLSLLAGALWACLAVTAQAATGTLTWEPVTQYEDGTAITKPVQYRVFVKEPGDATLRFLALATAPNRTVFYTKPGETCWHVAAWVDEDNDGLAELDEMSAGPAFACRTITLRPKAPANLVIQP